MATANPASAVTDLEALAGVGDAVGIVALCDCLELDLAHSVLAVHDSATVYKAQLLAHLLLGQTDAARFLWKRLPPQMREEPELQALWNVGKARWAKDTAAACAALGARQWAPPVVPTLASALESRLRDDEWATIGLVFSSIRPDTLASRLGLPVASASEGAAARGWPLEGECYRPVKPEPAARPVPGADALRRLTEFVAHLTAETGA